MKHIDIASVLPSLIKRGIATTVMCALFLIASNHKAFGQQWTQANGIGNTFIGCLATTGDTLMVSSGSGKKDSIFISTDNGNNWSMVSDNVPTVITTMVANGTDFIVGSDRPGGSFYSKDFGNTWMPNDSDFPLPSISNYSISSLVDIGDTIFAATGEGVYLQTAPGAPWTPDTVGMEYSGGEVPAANSLTILGTNWFVATQDAGAYLSTNDGASWLPVNNGLPPSYYYGTTVGAFASSDTTLFAVIPDTNFITTEIYSTKNNGQNWSQANLLPQNWGGVYGFLSSGHNLFVACDSGVYVSSDEGANWVQANQGLPVSNGIGNYILAMTTSGSNLAIGTFTKGVWIRKLSDFGNSSVSPNTNAASNMGLNLTLSENPASSSEAKVFFTLPEAGFAQMLLMDELGRNVRLLQNGFAQAGQNEVVIDPLALDPGTYFVRVEANGMTAMQKFVVAR
jgi:hypothetical protein